MTHADWTVDTTADFIRRRFDKMRAEFVSDPGGYLDYVWPAGEPTPADDIAAAAIRTVVAEWAPTGAVVEDVLPGTSEWDESEAALEAQRKRGG